MSTADFQILAAIDLRGRRVVRLVEGDFERETAYSDDPVATAGRLVEQGVRWLHVVDLDGAREGRPAQAELVTAIVGAARGRANVEVGGGIRTREAASAYLDAGLDRVVLGTAALSSTLAGDLIAAFESDRVAVAIDVRGDQAVGGAWQVGAGSMDLDSAIRRLLAEGVQVFEVTAIDRDGTLAGPDLELLRRAVRAAAGARVIASAGIRSVDDLRAVRDLGCAGAIVGRAIYEGTLDLEAAVAKLGS
jgi:phosphoribosylformimino-5-aminoimidazole carboxamide ribotide isomerase